MLRHRTQAGEPVKLDVGVRLHANAEISIKGFNFPNRVGPLVVEEINVFLLVLFDHGFRQEGSQELLHPNTSGAWSPAAVRGCKRLVQIARTQEKGAVTPQETDPDMPMSVQESPVEA